jgi:hypothetical protein
MVSTAISVSQVTMGFNTKMVYLGWFGGYFTTWETEIWWSPSQVPPGSRSPRSRDGDEQLGEMDELVGYNIWLWLQLELWLHYNL